MTSDYRDAMELTKLTRTGAINVAQKAMVLNFIPTDRKISAQVIIEEMVKRGITKQQVKNRLRIEFEAGTIIKYPQLLDGRRRLYRRKGVMG